MNIQHRLITQRRFDCIIESLQDALVKCKSVNYHDDAKCDDSPPFIIGWTSSTIKNVLIDLNNLKEDVADHLADLDWIESHMPDCN
jgi:hypothetical protein